MTRKKSTDAPVPTGTEAAASLPFCRANVAKERKAEWLIDGWLPRGRLVLIDGDKGAGKSYLAAAFAAYVTSKQTIPGRKPRKPAAVIWGAGEESIAEESKLKLRSAGCDLKRVCFLGMSPDGTLGDQPTFPADLPGLEALIRETGAVLTFLDPLRSYLSVAVSVGDEKMNGRIAVQMNCIAERTRSTILCCRHLTKAAARDALHAGTGSVAWGAVARMILRADESPTDGWERVLSVVRTNSGKAVQPQAYSVIETASGVRIDWGPLLDDEQVRDITSLFDGGQKLEGSVAEDLIRRELATGPRHASEIYAAGQKERIGVSAMWRAAKKLGIQPVRHGYGTEGYFEWTLPAPADAPPPHSRKRKSMDAEPS
jgi:AAA domain